MKSVRKILLVCLLLLAVPFQGAAAAAMLCCAPDHHVPPAAQMQHHGAHAHHHAAQADGQASSGKCGSCAACCVGAALAPEPFIAPAVPGSPSHAIAFLPRYVPEVTRPALERPPQFSLA